MGEAQLDRIEIRLDRLETDVAELKTDVAELKTDVAGLKTGVAGLKTDVNGLKIGVAELTAEVGSLHRSAVKHEAMHDELRQVAEAVRALGERMDRNTDDLRREMREMVAPIALAVPNHAAQLQDHEGRITGLESRRR